MKNFKDGKYGKNVNITFISDCDSFRKVSLFGKATG